MFKNIKDYHFLSLFTLCLVLIIDSMGMFLIYPVLVGLVLNPSTSVLDPSQNEKLVYFIVLASYWVFAFLVIL